MPKRTFQVLSLLVIVAMLLTACAQPMPVAPAPEAAAPSGDQAAAGESTTTPGEIAPGGVWTRILGADAWWSVPLAVAMGVPMYSNAAGIIPAVEALIGKGAALGTALAFMMAVVALSLPEMIILRRVLKLPLIATFVGIVAVGIMLTGYLFNFILAH